MTETKNLGLVKAIHSGTTEPGSTAMLWYDTNVGYHKYYNSGSSTWVALSSSALLFENGIFSDVDGKIKIGGTLTANTSIDLNGYIFDLTGGGQGFTRVSPYGYNVYANKDYSPMTNNLDGHSIFAADSQDKATSTAGVKLDIGYNKDELNYFSKSEAWGSKMIDGNPNNFNSFIFQDFQYIETRIHNYTGDVVSGSLQSNTNKTFTIDLGLGQKLITNQDGTLGYNLLHQKGPNSGNLFIHHTDGIKLQFSFDGDLSDSGSSWDLNSQHITEVINTNNWAIQKNLVNSLVWDFATEKISIRSLKSDISVGLSTYEFMSVNTATGYLYRTGINADQIAISQVGNTIIPYYSGAAGSFQPTNLAYNSSNQKTISTALRKDLTTEYAFLEFRLNDGTSPVSAVSVGDSLYQYFKSNGYAVGGIGFSLVDNVDGDPAMGFSSEYYIKTATTSQQVWKFSKHGGFGVNLVDDPKGVIDLQAGDGSILDSLYFRGSTHDPIHDGGLNYHSTKTALLLKQDTEINSMVTWTGSWGLGTIGGGTLNPSGYIETRLTNGTKVRLVVTDFDASDIL